MGNIKCAIAGLGRIGSTLEDDALREKPASHAGAIAENPECTLVAGCDIDREKRDAFSRRWQCTHIFPDIETMFSFSIPDILCIASPPETHKELVLKGVKAGVPLIICEKPLTENITEAEEIIKNVDTSPTVLMVNHERRYSRDYVHCRDLINRKLYGELHSLSCTLYMCRGRTVEELLWEDGTHMIDIIRFLTQSEVSDIAITGDLFKPGGGAVITLTLDKKYGIIDAACSRDYLMFELDLSFTRGLIRIGNGVYEEYESVTSPYYENFKSLIKKKTPGFPRTNYFSAMLADAVRIIKQGNKSHISADRKISPETDTSGNIAVSTGMDGYYAVKIISDIIKKSENC